VIMRRFALAIGLASTLFAAGCGRGGHAATPAAGPPCIAVTSTPAGDSHGSPLASVALPCVGGGGKVALGRLGRPAVVNLWANWCEPCQRELPAIEQYARRAGGSVLVVGVATQTDRSVVGDLVKDLGLTFPNLYDPGGTLLLAVGRTALPVTVFVDAAGQVAHVYNGAALDTASVSSLAEQYLKVPG
jgi:thiol-disulfide isomerase/thioredoxin